ncbi:MAG: isocitrate/isopropylmalate dehydrogenase family protein [Deltaproteobacteria bacterium]|nr:isocitrate/isopropylmalate dehydrogenase family protein [Deltaproteobacteria bacterium]
MKKTHHIAIIPGDGIGKEVVSEGVKCLNALSAIFEPMQFEFQSFSWGSDYFLQHGMMMPENGLEILKGFDAIYLGAVGDPRIPDDVTLHGLLLPIKFGFDLYVGLRPVYLFPGVDCPLAHISGGEIDIVVIRENTEGEYSNAGGIVGIGESELAIQSGLFTRKGIERIITFAFNYARQKGRKKVTSATKSNAQRYGMVLWDKIFKEVASRYPEIRTESKLIDAACMDVVRNPKGYDVIVASNLFADILSDLTASVTGGMGLAPGASFNPKDKTYPGFFDPVHGSAPDIAGKGVANPIAAILTAKLMLDYLGETEAGELLYRAVSQNLAEKKVRTIDLGGLSKTNEVGDDIVRILRSSK